MKRRPDDIIEFENWIKNPITQWFFDEMLEQFDPHIRILLTKSGDNVGELKGEQTVMKYIRNPREIYDA